MLLLFHYNLCCSFNDYYYYSLVAKLLKALSLGAKIYKKGKCENFFITKVFHLP